MDANRERCPVCDRVKATAAEYYALPPEPQSPGKILLLKHDYRTSAGMCWRYASPVGIYDCESRTINWRTRALAAEARIREAVEALTKPAGEFWEGCDYMDARNQALAILTREVQP